MICSQYEKTGNLALYRQALWVSLSLFQLNNIYIFGFKSNNRLCNTLPTSFLLSKTNICAVVLWVGPNITILSYVYKNNWDEGTPMIRHRN